MDKFLDDIREEIQCNVMGLRADVQALKDENDKLREALKRVDRIGEEFDSDDLLSLLDDLRASRKELIGEVS